MYCKPGFYCFSSIRQWHFILNMAEILQKHMPIGSTYVAEYKIKTQMCSAIHVIQ